MTKWRRLLYWAVVLGSVAPALGTTFSASLKDIVGQVPKARVEIKLVGCTGLIASTSGSTVAPFYASRFADGSGNISLTVPDQASYACANGGGPIYYHVSIYYADSRGLEQKGPEGDFDITGSTFSLNSAVPRTGVLEWLLATLRGIPLDPSIGTPVDGDAVVFDSISGKYKARHVSGGTGHPVVLSGIIDFPLIADGACTDQTFSGPGATASDVVVPAWPAGLNPGLTGNMFVGSTDTVTVRMCNNSGAAVDPSSATFKAILQIYSLSASAVIDFAPIPDGACLANSLTLTGAAIGDSVVPGWPSSLASGVIGDMAVASSSTVQVRLCNFSGATVDLGSLTFKAGIAQ